MIKDIKKKKKTDIDKLGLSIFYSKSRDYLYVMKGTSFF